MNEQVSAWLSAVDGLQDAHERLSQVEILCQPAVDVISSRDHENAFFYLDPPYVPETRVAGEYSHEMTVEDHEEFLSVVNKCSGRVMISGYDSELYNDSLSEEWRRVEIKTKKHSSSSKEKPTATEVLWMNYNGAECRS